MGATANIAQNMCKWYTAERLECFDIGITLLIREDILLQMA